MHAKSRKGGIILKKEKLSDRVFLRIMITSIIGILLCISSLSATTWAWFTASEDNVGNVISSGKLDLRITVTDSLGDEVSSTPLDKSSIYILAAGVYTVTLTVADTSTVTKGFSTVKAGGVTYKTGAANTGETNPISFTLSVGEDDTTVVFDTMWGLPAEPDVLDGGTLTI